MRESYVVKQFLLTLVVVSGLAVPGLVFAEATVYGNVHLSINDFNSAQNLNMSSNTSAIGVKGWEDLGEGVKAIYKIEFQIDPDERSKNITDRDQYAGLYGGMGTIKFGTMSSNYKQTGGKIDPLYRTLLEGRGFLNTQSPDLHDGAGINRGRQTNTIQYVSPQMGGIQAVVNTTVSGADNETMGFGVRYTTSDLLVYVDWVDGQTGTAANVGGTTQSATKVGGKFDGGVFTVSAQFESAEDRTGNDYTYLAGTYNIDNNNMVAVSWGQANNKNAALDTTGVAMAFDHKLSKLTNVYLGYGSRGAKTAADDLTTLGFRKKF